jgi:hypothetical protein
VYVRGPALAECVGAPTNGLLGAPTTQKGIANVKKRETKKDTTTKTKAANANLTAQQLEAVCGGDGRSYVTGY